MWDTRRTSSSPGRPQTAERCRHGPCSLQGMRFPAGLQRRSRGQALQCPERSRPLAEPRRVGVRERGARDRAIAAVRVRPLGRDAPEHEPVARQPGIDAHFEPVVDTSVRVRRGEDVVGERDVAHLVVASNHLATAVGQTSVDSPRGSIPDTWVTRFQPIDAMISASVSAGVGSSSVMRGRVLRRHALASKRAWLYAEESRGLDARHAKVMRVEGAGVGRRLPSFRWR